MFDLRILSVLLQHLANWENKIATYPVVQLHHVGLNISLCHYFDDVLVWVSARGVVSRCHPWCWSILAVATIIETAGSTFACACKEDAVVEDDQ